MEGKIEKSNEWINAIREVMGEETQSAEAKAFVERVREEIRREKWDIWSDK